MQATKRLAFLLVLFAFLGNLALGIGLPVVSKHSIKAFNERTKQQHYSHKEKSSALFLTLEETEETEEIEESEADSNFDSNPTLQHICSVYSVFLTQLFAQIYAAPRMANLRGTFRSWLWVKQEIFIHYQVFRI